MSVWYPEFGQFEFLLIREVYKYVITINSHSFCNDGKRLIVDNILSHEAVLNI